MKPHVIVTGGGQGIGKTTTLELLKQKYCVSVFDRDIEALDELKTEVDNKHCALYHVDVANEQQVKCTIDESVEKFNALYGLINNAAISSDKHQ